MKDFKILPLKPEVSFSDLEKLDVRVGLIKKVEEVMGSDKLVCLLVDFGEFSRKILVGMKKERADVQEVVGKQALFVINLPPKQMAGQVSEGMLFDIGYGNGIIPVLAVPEKEVPNGVSVG